MPHKGNWPFLLHFCILDNKNVSRDSRDTKVDPHWVQDQPWSLNGPYGAPIMDFEIVEPFSGLVCNFYIIYTL